MYRLHQSAAGRRGGLDNYLVINERFVVAQLRFFYRRLRRSGITAYEARNTVWMCAWLGTLPGAVTYGSTLHEQVPA